MYIIDLCKFRISGSAQPTLSLTPPQKKGGGDKLGTNDTTNTHADFLHFDKGGTGL